jgi:hypothetical protein
VPSGLVKFVPSGLVRWFGRTDGHGFSVRPDWGAQRDGETAGEGRRYTPRAEALGWA